MPQISVLMPVKNNERYVREAIKSILDQTFSDFELFIINDGSGDKTPEITGEFRDPRIQIINHQKSIGMALSLNEALARARAKFIVRMDGDDIALPERFARQIEYMEKNPDCVLCGSLAKIIDENGNETGTLEYPRSDRDLRRVFFRYNPVIHPSMMLRREILEKTGGYKNLWGGEDYDIVLRFAAYGKIANLPGYLLKYRLYKNSGSHNAQKLFLWRSIVARWKAIWEYGYPKKNILYLIKPIISLIIPIAIKSRFGYGRKFDK